MKLEKHIYTLSKEIDKAELKETYNQLVNNYWGNGNSLFVPVALEDNKLTALRIVKNPFVDCYREPMLQRLGLVVEPTSCVQEITSPDAAKLILQAQANGFAVGNCTIESGLPGLTLHTNKSNYRWQGFRFRCSNDYLECHEALCSCMSEKELLQLPPYYSKQFVDEIRQIADSEIPLLPRHYILKCFDVDEGLNAVDILLSALYRAEHLESLRYLHLNLWEFDHYDGDEEDRNYPYSNDLENYYRTMVGGTVVMHYNSRQLEKLRGYQFNYGKCDAIQNHIRDVVTILLATKSNESWVDGLMKSGVDRKYFVEIDIHKNSNG